MNYSYFNNYNTNTNEMIQNNGMISSYYTNGFPTGYKGEMIYNSIFPLSEVKQRKKISRGQLKLLEKTYLETNKPNLSLRKFLANKLNMTPRSVQIWFQNKRAKDKLKNNLKNNAQSNTESENQTNTSECKEEEIESSLHDNTSLENQNQNQMPEPRTEFKKAPAPLNLDLPNKDEIMMMNMMNNNNNGIMNVSDMNPFVPSAMCLTPLSAGFPNVYSEDSEELYYRRNSFPLESPLKNPMSCEPYFFPNNEPILNESFNQELIPNSYFAPFQPFRNNSLDLSLLSYNQNTDLQYQTYPNFGNNNNSNTSANNITPTYYY